MSQVVLYQLAIQPFLFVETVYLQLAHTVQLSQRLLVTDLAAEVLTQAIQAFCGTTVLCGDYITFSSV